jgi:hypothetical protein
LKKALTGRGSFAAEFAENALTGQELSNLCALCDLGGEKKTMDSG